jgi:hypothetical protein
MVVENSPSEAPRALLGLRPPAEPSERASRRTAAALPERPSYQVISSGRDSEDEEGRGKTSDLVTALGAGAVLVIFLAAIGLLLS